MKSLTVHIPELLDFDEPSVNRYLAAKLFEDGRLSLGKAAEMAGMTKRAFMDILKSFGTSVLNYSPESLDDEFKAIQGRHR